MVETLRIAYDEVREAEIMYIEANSDLEILSARNSDVKRRLDTKKKEIEQLEAICKEARDQAKIALKKAQKMKAEADDAVNAFLDEQGSHLSTLTVEELEGEIDSEKARLELMHGGDGHMIVQYERREREIERLKQKLEVVESGLAEITGKIATIRGQWEPKLDALVERISRAFNHNMQQISCAGEVGIHKDNEFDQWAIQIMVKFRDHEPLTQLDSHRQSGGERAVSTVFYLMSLQSLTRSPFRVVDEINQGMDPRNERLVHARMVAIATGNDEWQAQYDAAAAAAATQASAAAPPLPATSGGGTKNKNRRKNNNEDDDDNDNDDEDDEDTSPLAETDMLHRPAAITAATAQGSQYFLITPKLLHDLRYEPGMRVLCIASGEYVPRDQASISFEHSLQIRRRLTAAATS